MIVGIQDVYYSVTDTKRAIRFYTEALGMKLLEESEHWIALDCCGTRIGLHPGAESIPLVPRDSHGAHAGATLTLKSDDVSGDRKYGGRNVACTDNREKIREVIAASIVKRKYDRTIVNFPRIELSFEFRKRDNP